MIFLAVGTQFGFDRLVRMIDLLVQQKGITEEVFAQIGPGKYKPISMKYVTSLNKDEFDKTFSSCSAMISHAGIGNISLALKANKPLLVLPRLRQYGEVVNNHQVDTARKFEQLGHVVAVYDEKELPKKIKLLKTFMPQPRFSNRMGITDRISLYMQKLANQ